MKKILSTLLIMSLILSMFTIGASAAIKTSSSVEQKGAPQATEGKIFDKDGNLAVNIPLSDITITSLAEKEKNGEHIEGLLENAWKQVQAADVITDLCPDAANHIPNGYTVEDLVITDLFDVSVLDKYTEYLSVPGNTIAVTFKLGYIPLMVLHNISGTNWEVISDDRISISGTDVTIILDSLSAIAFINDLVFVKDKTAEEGNLGGGTTTTKTTNTDTTATDSNQKVVKSPQTGESDVAIILGMALVTLGAACVAFRKKEEE